MKIKSPILNVEEAQVLSQVGADEFFCGVEPYYWRKEYKELCVNQRASSANFTKLKDLKKAISIAHKNKVKVHVAVNAFFFLKQQYQLGERIIRDVLDIGADGIIFADAVLLAKLYRRLLKGKDVVIGCDATVFNSAAANFFKNLGATRIVFPRAMTIPEMREVASLEGCLEYEVFIIHDLCFFVDGFCTYCKQQLARAEKTQKKTISKQNICFLTSSYPKFPRRRFLYGCRDSFKQYKVSLEGDRRIASLKPFSFWNKKHIDGCGACAIYDFKEMGIASLKILDRGKPLKEKARATLFIKKCLDFLNLENPSRSDYIDKCQDLFTKTFKLKCNRYDCYYPSVFLDGKRNSPK